MNRSKFAAIGWESCPVEWWLDIADQLTTTGQPWCESAALMDLRMFEGQIRLGKRRRIPSRRQLMARWHWNDWKVRQMLKSEQWKDDHHRDTTQSPPKNLPKSSQKPPKFGQKTEVEPNSTTQNPPKSLPNPSQDPPHARNSQTQNTNTDHPAGLAGIQIKNLAGIGGKNLWPGFVNDLIAAGYQTLEQLAQTDRQCIADDLGRGASAKRLDKLERVIQAHGLKRSAHQPARQPTPNVAITTTQPTSLLDRYALPEPTHQPGSAPWDLVDYSGDKHNGH